MFQEHLKEMNRVVDGVAYTIRTELDKIDAQIEKLSERDVDLGEVIEAALDEIFEASIKMRAELTELE